MTNTTTPAKKVKKRQTSHIEFFKLCEWVKNADLSGISTFVGCAELASKDVGFPVPPGAIHSALEVTGIKLPERKANGGGKRDRTQILARELASLLRELGKEPSAELMSIVNRTGA